MRRGSRSLDMERAGIDIVTDGEQRRESYSNRFATALDGVDLDKLGDGDRPHRPPESGSADRRPDRPPPAPRSRCATSSSCARNTDRRIKITLPGPFTMGQQAQDDFYRRSRRGPRLAYAAAVNAEAHRPPSRPAPT